MKYLFRLTLVLLLTAGIVGCSDFLTPNTPQNKSTQSVDSVDDLEGLMTGAYNRLSQTAIYGRAYVVLGDVRTGNAFSNGNSGRFINSSLFGVTPSGSVGIWDAAYEAIANTNVIIQSNIEGEGIDQVKGEAYAVRALAHMILLKQYGQQYVEGSDFGIPYITTIGNQDNFFPDRPPVQTTIDSIAADFERAVNLLDPTINEPVTRMTYYAVRALQSRFYLFAENYSAASAAAKEVIDSDVYSLVSANSYVTAWASDGEPAVLFEVAMTQSDNRGSDSIFQIIAGESYGDVEVTEELFNLYGSSDVRNGLYGVEAVSYDETNPWESYRMVGKYPDQYKNTPVIRYAEVILNYAEAQARMDNTGEALTYLNMIPENRNADTYSTASIDNILLERRKELAMEGHYYWDLLRTGQNVARDNMRPAISSNEVTVPFGDFKLAYPIPLAETNANPNLQQNEGY